MTTINISNEVALSFMNSGYLIVINLLLVINLRGKSNEQFKVFENFH